MKYPWYKEFASDLLADFQFQCLGMKERGLLYTLKLLAGTNKFSHGKLVMKRDGEAVPLQAYEISVSLGMDLSELEPALAKLVDFGLIDFSEGCYFFSKMVAERQLSEKRSFAGSKGGSKTQAKPQAKFKQTYKQNPKQSVKQTSVSVSVSDSVSNSVSKKSKSKKFKIPELGELTDYFFEKLQDLEASGIEAEKFWDYYQSKGWKVGRTKMKDWQAAVRNWIKTKNQFTYENSNSKNNKSRNQPNADFSTTDEEFLRKNGFGN